MKKAFKSFWEDLNPVAKIFLIASLIMAPLVFFSGFEFNVENRSGIFPNNGIGLGYNEHIQIDDVQLAFITTTEPYYISIRYNPHFLNDTRSNYVLFELPYDGKLDESYEQYKSELGDREYEQWQVHRVNDVTILYKIYYCEKENPCKRPYNGNEEIHFDLNEKIDSKLGDSHTIQLKVHSGLSNESINFLYDNLRNKEDRNPIYGFHLVNSNQVKLIVNDKIVLEQSTPVPTLDYFSTSKENRNKFYEWSFDSQIAIEINYKLPSDNSLRPYFGLFSAIELLLVGPFVGLLVKYRQKHPHNVSKAPQSLNNESSQKKSYNIEIPPFTSKYIDNPYVNPRICHASVGQPIIWQNNDDTTHSITSGRRKKISSDNDVEDGVPDGLFDKILNPHENFEFSFTKEGTYHYYCKIHKCSEATIVIK